MKLYLIRHGESFLNLPNWTGGHINAGLTELGHEQAKMLASWLQKNIPEIDILYNSTLLRAIETAGYLSENYEMPIHPDDRIREVSANRFDHSPWDNEKLPQEFEDFWGTDRPYVPIVREEGGESWMHFRLRVSMFIEEICHKHAEKTVLVICHGGVIEATIAHIFNLGAWQNCDMRCDNTSITHFEYTQNQPRKPWRLYYHNRIEHLHEINKITV